MNRASSHLPRAARAVPPGLLLRREIDARGWTQKDLAEVMCRPEHAVSEIISGAKQITTEAALSLSRALGTSAELWLNLETAWQLFNAQQSSSRDA